MPVYNFAADLSAALLHPAPREKYADRLHMMDATTAEAGSEDWKKISVTSGGDYSDKICFLETAM